MLRRAVTRILARFLPLPRCPVCGDSEEMTPGVGIYGVDSTRRQLSSPNPRKQVLHMRRLVSSGKPDIKAAMT
jgi:hypothetical protein